MPIQVTVDTTGFERMTKELSRVSGTALWPVILNETGRILERCVELTTRDKAEQITRSVQYRNRTLRKSKTGPPEIYITLNGVIWFADEPGPGNEGKAHGRQIAGKTFHPMSEFFHWSDDRWNRYSGLLDELKARYINPREVIGRAGQRWIQIGDALGIEVSAPGYVKDAPPYRGRSYIDGRAQKTETATQLFVDIFESAPILLTTIDGRRILQTAINGRISYFEQNMRRGVFDDLKARATRYPGVFVQ